MHDAPIDVEGGPAAGIARHTRRWIEQFVIGLNLCPFAAPVLRGEQLRIAVCEQTDGHGLLEAVQAELELLRDTPERDLATSVLVFSQALGDFDDYLDFLALAEELLYESGLEGSVQIASFHPSYRFDGAPLHDVANYTNRAPYPMLHFLREDSISRVLERYPEPAAIPERNVEKLRTMGREAVQALLLEIATER